MKPEDIRCAIASVLWQQVLSDEGARPHKRTDDVKLYGGGYSKGCWIYMRGDGSYRGMNYPTEAALVEGEFKEYVRLYNWPQNLIHAIQLCDVLTQEGWVCSMDNGLDKTWECVFYKNNMGEKTPTHYGAAATLSGAICESFLRVKGLWDDGDSAN